MRLFILAVFMLLQGCFGSNTKPQVETVYVRVDVPGPVVPCRIDPITPPIDLVESLKDSDNIHYKSTKSLSYNVLLNVHKNLILVTICNNQ